MAFSSAAFVFAFLPAVFLLHLVIRGRLARNVLLLLASLLFYSAGSLPHLPLLVGVTLLNYLAGLLFRKRLRIRKAVLAVTLCLNVAVLALFKYLGFFGGVIGDLTGLSLRLPALALPIGVSFFTFQGMSYAIDVYRDPDSGTTDFFELLLYISFFPQLIAGPIVQYHDVAPQLRRRAADVRQMAEGFRRFIVGLGKKLLLADVLGTAVDALYARTDLLDARTALLVGIAYCLQIYFDFSGYSDMAIGMGRLFGFRFPENFDHPYTGSSIREFWRRWHISLSMWFRNYVYIPLGGSRRGLARTCFNTFVVFLLTGLWHGAMWTFVLWGLWNGFWLILERATPLKKVSHTLFGHVYMLLIVMLGFILFRAESLTQAGRICRALADFRFEREGTILLRGVLSAKVLAAGAVAVFLSTGLQRKLAEKLRRSSGCQAAEYAASLLCLAICVLRIASVSFNPFIYFRF